MYTLLFFLPILAAVTLSFQNIDSRIWQGVWISAIVFLIFYDLLFAGILGAVLTIALIIKQQLPKPRDF
jgi:hypothetical protein